MVGDHSFLPVTVVLLTSFHRAHDDDRVQATLVTMFLSLLMSRNRKNQRKRSKEERQATVRGVKSNQGGPQHSSSLLISLHTTFWAPAVLFCEASPWSFFSEHPLITGKLLYRRSYPTTGGFLRFFWVYVDLFLKHVINLEPLQFKFSLD